MSLWFIPSGGLGNILFQHHAAYTHAKTFGLHLLAPAEHPSDRACISHYHKLFKHVNLRPYRLNPDYWDPNFAKYTPIPPHARVLRGFFQSLKYFEKYQIEIRDLLRLNESDTWADVYKVYTAISQGKNTVCVHVRRGDTTEQELMYTLLSEDYYERALSNFEGFRVIVFSDEIDKVVNWNIWKSRDVYFVNEPDALRAFFLMTLCDNFIIANSTFSLSAYYMREHIDAKLLAPKHWFGPMPPCNITEWPDILHPDCVLID